VRSYPGSLPPKRAGVHGARGEGVYSFPLAAGRAFTPESRTMRVRQHHQLSDCVAHLVGARLRELRTDAELTQTEIARRTGIHRPIVARYAAALGLDTATVLVCLDVEWLEAGWIERTVSV
jgi:DNA-binding transcriptional regulator YiaG